MWHCCNQAQVLSQNSVTHLAQCHFSAIFHLTPPNYRSVGVSRGTFLTIMKKTHSVTNESNIATSARCGHAHTNNHKWNLTLMFVNFSFLKNIRLLSGQLTSSVSWLSSLSVLFQKYLCNLKEFYWRNSQLPINPRIHENIFLSVLISSPGESWYQKIVRSSAARGSINNQGTFSWLCAQASMPSAGTEPLALRVACVSKMLSRPGVTVLRALKKPS